MAKVIGSDALGALKTWILNKLSGKANTSGTYSGLTVGNATNAQNARYADYADYAGSADWSSIDNKPNTLNIQFTVGSSTYSYDVFYDEA